MSFSGALILSLIVFAVWKIFSQRKNRATITSSSWPTQTPPAIQTSDRCPSCEQQLGLIPKRRVKCPHCDEYMVVRRGVLVSEYDAKEKEDKERLQFARQNAAHNKQQQLSVGVRKYTWQSAGDERVCERCEEYDGKMFSWNATPPGGHPGEHDCPDGSCRCIALPMFNDPE